MKNASAKGAEFKDLGKYYFKSLRRGLLQIYLS